LVLMNTSWNDNDARSEKDKWKIRRKGGERILPHSGFVQQVIVQFCVSPQYWKVLSVLRTTYFLFYVPSTVP